MKHPKNTFINVHVLVKYEHTHVFSSLCQICDFIATISNKFQIGAAASPQSQAIPSRDYLDNIEKGIKEELGPDGTVPLPNWWIILWFYTISWFYLTEIVILLCCSGVDTWLNRIWWNFGKDKQIGCMIASYSVDRNQMTIKMWLTMVKMVGFMNV